MWFVGFFSFYNRRRIYLRSKEVRVLLDQKQNLSSVERYYNGFCSLFSTVFAFLIYSRDASYRMLIKIYVSVISYIVIFFFNHERSAGNLNIRKHIFQFNSNQTSVQVAGCRVCILGRVQNPAGQALL